MKLGKPRSRTTTYKGKFFVCQYCTEIFCYGEAGALVSNPEMTIGQLEDKGRKLYVKHLQNDCENFPADISSKRIRPRGLYIFNWDEAGFVLYEEWLNNKKRPG